MAKDKTFLEAFASRQDAKDERDRYAATLKALGRTPSHQVGVEQMRGIKGERAWAVYLYTETEPIE